MLQVLKLFFDVTRRTGQGDPLQGHARPVVRDRHPRSRSRPGGEPVPRHQGHPGAPRQQRRAEDPGGAREPQDQHQARARGQEEVQARSTVPSALHPDRPVYGKALAQAIRAAGEVPDLLPDHARGGHDYAQKPRVYKINGTGEDSPPHSQRAAYKWVFSLPGASGEYYGFEGDPRGRTRRSSTTRPRRGRSGTATYELFYDGDRLRMVAWQTDEGSFWLSNTLIQTAHERRDDRDRRGHGELPPAGELKKRPRRPRAPPGERAEGADRRGRGRLGRPGHRRLLRRARAPRGRGRDRPEKVEALRRGELPIHEPGLAELIERNRERLTFTTEMAELLERSAPAVRLRADPADLLGRRRPVGASIGRWSEIGGRGGRRW